MTKNTHSARLLIVDDDSEIRGLLVRYLREQGFAAEAVADGEEMDARLEQSDADLIVLDLMLPGEDGLSIARRLRRQRQIPIIMLSARGEELDRIIGLEVGADDYLAKPFNPRELLARIRAVLRRSAHASGTEQGAAAEAGIVFGRYRLDPEARILWRDDREIELTSGEMDVLIALASHPNRVLSRDQILDFMDRDNSDRFDRSIDVRITRLRRKLGDSASRYIRTVWGAGYRFTPSGTEQ